MIKRFIDRFRTNKYLMGTVYVGAGSIFAAFFSYLLQFVFGRILSVADFGTFNALISLSYLFGVPAGVLGVSLVKYVSELSSRQEMKKLTALYWKLIAISLALGLGVFLILFSIRYIISVELKIFDEGAVTMFGLVMGVAFFSTINPSYLQGLLRYKAFALYNVASSAYRFFFAVAAVLLGFKLAGAFGGILIAVFASFLTAYILLRKNLTNFENISLTRDYKRILVFSLPVMFVHFGLMLLNNLDVILVKRYFDADTAGYYAGTVTLGKIFLFGAGAVATVMFPTISSLAARGLDYSRVFIKFLFLQLSLVAGGLAVFSIFPSFLTKIFFGERFMTSVEYLPMFSIFIGLYVIVNFLIVFFLAINKTEVFLLLVPGLVVQYFSIVSSHENLYEVIKADIFAGVITLTLLTLFFVLKRNEKTTNEI